MEKFLQIENSWLTLVRNFAFRLFPSSMNEKQLKERCMKWIFKLEYQPVTEMKQTKDMY